MNYKKQKSKLQEKRVNDKIKAMSIVIKKINVLPFLHELKEEGFFIYAPTDKNGETVFETLENIESQKEKLKKINLIYSTTILPPQKIVFSSEQDLFHFELRRRHYKNRNQKILPSAFTVTPTLTQEKILFFGVHLYDIHAFLLLDECFKKPLEDEYYLNKRKNISIIGINYVPNINPFHKAIGLDVRRGYDLFFNDIGSRFLVVIGSELGKKMIATGKQFFEDSIWEEDIIKPKVDPLFSNLQILSKAVEKGKNSKLWQELAEICFGCGNCTYVCPLCYCYEVEDKMSLNLKKGRRLRRWDSCLSPDFAIIAGGINFRKTLAERLYNWYYHKFVRMPHEYGKPGCVGCGRCITYCPAGINLYKNLKRLLNEL